MSSSSSSSSSSGSSSRRGTRLYVGNLSSKTREKDLDRVFDKYGYISRIDLKNGFGFVEYEDSADADYAVRRVDGYELDGRKWIVEHARGPKSNGSGPGGPPRRSFKSSGFGFRLRVEGLDARTSWQDLKDFARKAGDVAFTDVWTDRGKKFGVIEYKSKADFKEALKSLDDATLDGKRLRLFDDRESSKSRSRSRGGSRSRSPEKKRTSRSRSRSRDRGHRSCSPSPAGNDKDRDSKSADDKDKEKQDKRSSRSRSRERSRDRSGSRSPNRARDDGDAPKPSGNGERDGDAGKARDEDVDVSPRAQNGPADGGDD